VLEGDNAQLREVVTSTGGALVVAGAATSTATLGAMSTTSTGSLVAQVSSAGTTAWIRNAPIFVTALEAATAGVVYAGGSFSGTLMFAGSPVTAASPTSDAVLLSYDPTGGERDATGFGTSDGDESLFGLSFRDGSLAVGGDTSGQFVRQTRRGGNDAFFGRSSPGSIPTVTQYGGVENDQITDVALGAGGSYSIVGWYEGSADFGGVTPLADLDDSPFTQSFFVAGYSSAGDQTWVLNAARYYGESGAPANVAVDPDGNPYFATGFWRPPADFGDGPLPTIAAPFLVGKVSGGGELLWARALHANVSVGGISVDTDGHVYLVGSYWAPDSADVFGTGEALPSGVMQDCVVASLDGTDGTLRWATTIAGLDNIYCYDIATRDGGAWVVGSFRGSVDFDGDLRTASGVGSDGFLAHIEP